MQFSQIHNFDEFANRFEQFFFNAKPVNKLHTLAFHTGVHDKNNDKSLIKISPNPTNNELLIELNGESQPKSVAILDEKGKEILTSEFKIRIDINKLSNGIYFLLINNKLIKFIKSN